MKTLPVLPFLFLLAFSVNAQSSAKKYVFLEHFTNSKCSICASKNPAFYSLISQAQYADDIHHISIHPPVPYNTCVFYLANTVENNEWANLYSIQGTPRVAVNGHLIPSSSQLLKQDTLNKYLNLTSPLYLKVTETGTGNTRTAKIEARVLDQMPAGNFKLYVAVAEKTINLVTPNNEAVHHDVFRDMLTPMTGVDFVPPAPGQSVEFTYTYTIDAAWNPSEMYALAFVKDEDTKQVLNSGTKFDAALSGVNELPAKSLQLSPNPASEAATALLGDDVALSTELFSLDGQRIISVPGNLENKVTINTKSLAPGIYFVKITGKKGIYSSKLVRS